LAAQKRPPKADEQKGMSSTPSDHHTASDPDRDRRQDSAGYAMAAAPVDAWRDYDVDDPDPGYFEFDWLSARHPDLYDRFALSSDGLMRELPTLVDLSGLIVCDVGAGTGRSTRATAAIANRVIAVDAYESVVRFAEVRARQSGIHNVRYGVADRAHLPLEDNSVDAVIACWAIIDDEEAFRVVRPGGWIIKMSCAPNALVGELTKILAEQYPSLVRVLPTPSPEWFKEGCPAKDFVESLSEPLATKLVDGVRHVHDFTHTAHYEGSGELAAIVGRLYGPRAASYIEGRGQSTLTWRLRIEYMQVARWSQLVFAEKTLPKQGEQRGQRRVPTPTDPPLTVQDCEAF